VVDIGAAFDKCRAVARTAADGRGAGRVGRAHHAIHHAVKDIITSKTFDNGVICASEQSIIVEGCIYDAGPLPGPPLMVGVPDA
jgi:acyl-CoA reductase-like NAD-dependent aldehyde dehydrogenase